MALASSNATFTCGGSSGDDGGPRMQPCRCIQEALRAAGIEYDKVIAGHGSLFPLCAKARVRSCAMRSERRRLALKLPNRTVITHSRAILS
jgi:hypothetical protein